MQALSWKSVIQKTATVLVCSGTEYDGQFLQEPLRHAEPTAVLAMDVLFESHIDMSDRVYMVISFFAVLMKSPLCL